MKPGGHNKGGTHFGASSMVGVVACATMEISIFHPIDSACKRIMTHGGRLLTTNDPWPVKKRMLEVVVFRENVKSGWLTKVASLYPGVSYAIFYKIGQRGVNYGCQPSVYEYFQGHQKDAFHRVFGKFGDAAMYGIAGGLLGIAECIVLPLDTLKIISQTNQAALRERSWLDIFRTEGFKLYRGWGWTATRNFPGSTGMFFGSYYVKSEVFQLEHYSKAKPLQDAAASIFGTFLSLTLSSPFDVIKARVQKSSIDSRLTGWQIAWNLWRMEGPGGFFKGLGTKYIVVGPKLVLSFTVFQQVMACTDRYISALLPQSHSHSLLVQASRGGSAGEESLLHDKER